MMTNFSHLLLFILIACSAPSEKAKDSTALSDTSQNSDFSGYLELAIDGETHKTSDLTRSGSRVSFQDEAIAVYVDNPSGDGTIAQATLLSPTIYNSTSHTYVNESGRWEEDMVNEEAKKSRQNLSFKFRRIDNLTDEKYLKLDRGTVDVEYDDEQGNFKLNFKGEDRPSSYNKEDNELVKFSGTLVLEGAYLMDSRD